jgi:hypothetical protein
MGLLNLIYLEAEKVYICGQCKVHLSEVNEIISKVIHDLFSHFKEDMAKLTCLIKCIYLFNLALTFLMVL